MFVLHNLYRKNITLYIKKTILQRFSAPPGIKKMSTEEIGTTKNDFSTSKTIERDTRNMNIDQTGLIIKLKYVLCNAFAGYLEKWQLKTKFEMAQYPFLLCIYQAISVPTVPTFITKCTIG